MAPDRKVSSFLDLIRRSERGRLKVYLGYAPGVGKTYLMLQEGHRLKQEGVDVVVGLVETHGRGDTAALLEGLEIVPRQQVTYRGITLEEMNTDAILSRKPRIVLVDELAHTNPPDSKNSKRYMDVEELLAAGIHVISTMNVQHLESLYNTVEGLVNVRVAERVPDLVLKQADEIVNVDLSPEDLVKRLEKGKIYPQERVSLASQNYFQAPRLEQLRELTLRETASQIDFKRREQHDDSAAVPPDQIVVCLSASGPNNANLLRYGSRLAGRLNRRWYAVHVQTPKETPLKIDAGKQRVLADALTLANQLGAMVFTLKGEDVVETILRFARDYRVGHVVIGRPNKRTLMQRVFTPKNNVEKLIEAGSGYRIVVLDERIPEIGDTATNEIRVELDRVDRPLSSLPRFVAAAVWDHPMTKATAIRELHELIVKRCPSEVQPASVEAVLTREAEMSTFLNEGLAVPHAVVSGLSAVYWAAGIPRQGIVDADARNKVQLVVLAMYPPNKSGEYLAGISELARTMRDLQRIDSLRLLTNADELFQWLSPD